MITKQKKIVFAVPHYSSLKHPIVNALKKLGYCVYVYHYNKPSLKARIVGFLRNRHMLPISWAERIIHREIQDALLRFIDDNKPDYFLTIKGEMINIDTIQKIKHRGIITINWYSDWLYFPQWVFANVPVYDLFVCTALDVYDALKAKKSRNIAYIPFGAESDASWNKTRNYDISFVGQCSKQREYFFRSIRDLNLNIWGYSKWLNSSLAKITHPQISPQQGIAIYRHSKIVINILPGGIKQRPNQLNIRIFEGLGAGSLVITQDFPLLHKYFTENKHIVTFKTPKELYKKVTFYLRNDKERKRIAQNGWKEVKNKHSYVIRMKLLFDRAKKIAETKQVSRLHGKKVVLAVPFNSSFRQPLFHAFTALGADVTIFDYRNILGNLQIKWSYYLVLIIKHVLKNLNRKFYKIRFPILNAMLLDLCKRLKPKYLFVVKGESITKDTIDHIKGYDVNTILWQVDPSLHPHIWSYVEHVGKSYDLYISCEPDPVIQKLRKKGFRRVAYMLGAADGNMMQFVHDTPKKYDVVLIGTYHPIREKYLKALEGLDVHVWGWGDWENSSVAHMFHGTALTQKEMFNVYKQSKIIINVGRALNSPIPTNLRIFESAQVGAFILVDFKKNLSEILTIGKEIDCFKNPQELRKKVIYYLNHPQQRKKMAKALYERVLAEHTYDRRLSQIFANF